MIMDIVEDTVREACDTDRNQALWSWVFQSVGGVDFAPDCKQGLY